jgi:hypothetical protein
MAFHCQQRIAQPRHVLAKTSDQNVDDIPFHLHIKYQHQRGLHVGGNSHAFLDHMTPLRPPSPFHSQQDRYRPPVHGHILYSGNAYSFLLYLVQSFATFPFVLTIG